jgi:hypothetical protein
MRASLRIPRRDSPAWLPSPAETRSMPSRLLLLLGLAATCAAFLAWRGQSPAVHAVEKQPPTFAKEGVAFLKTHCLHCHSEKRKKADISLHVFQSDSDLLKDRKLWQKVVA